MRTRTNHSGTRRWLLPAIGLLIMVVLTSCGLVRGQGSEESLSEGWVVEWQRIGGIAGFCDTVTIGATGRVTVWSCRTEPAARVGDTQLTADELATLDEWQGLYRSTTITQSDPATADSMTVTLDFVGTGSTNLPDEVAGRLDRLAQELIRRANP